MFKVFFNHRYTKMADTSLLSSAFLVKLTTVTNNCAISTDSLALKFYQNVLSTNSRMPTNLVWIKFSFELKQIKTYRNNDEKRRSKIQILFSSYHMEVSDS